MFLISLFSEETPNTSLAWLLYAALAFMLLMIVVGWLSGQREEDQPIARHEAGRLAKRDRRKPG